MSESGQKDAPLGFPGGALPPGVCERCALHRIVGNARGSTFLLCLRFMRDSRFPKYPSLPLADCPGFMESP
jgi:hypothetical protein